MGLRRVCPDVRFLGSYPRAEPAGDEPRDPPAGNADDVYRDAAAWLGRIRDGRT
jgi:prephenate dehydratase